MRITRQYSVGLLIFDLDGTLADTKKDLATSVNFTLKELGLPEKEPEEIYRYVGTGVRRLLQQVISTSEGALYKRSLQVFRRHYLEHLLDTTDFYPGVREVLIHFGSKKLAVATNKPMEYTTRIIEGLGAKTLFDIILGGDSVPNLKPHPDLISKICKELGIDRNRTVMIGDGVSDILAAKKAGIKVCAVGYGLTPKGILLDARPDFLCDTPTEIMRLFV